MLTFPVDGLTRSSVVMSVVDSTDSTVLARFRNSHAMLSGRNRPVIEVVVWPGRRLDTQLLWVVVMSRAYLAGYLRTSGGG